MSYFSRLIYSRGVKRGVMSFTTRHRYGKASAMPLRASEALPLTSLWLVRERSANEANRTAHTLRGRCNRLFAPLIIFLPTKLRYLVELSTGLSTREING